MLGLPGRQCFGRAVLRNLAAAGTAKSSCEGAPSKRLFVSRGHAYPVRGSFGGSSCRRNIAALAQVAGGHRDAGGEPRIAVGLAVSTLLLSTHLQRQGASCEEEGPRRSESRLYPKDLEKLTKIRPDNPSPVVVPPPMPGLARQQWSQRHVAPIFGLPMRGKSHVARELKHYIEFFHGARAEVFDVNKYLGPGGDEELFQVLVEFFRADSQEDAYDFSQKGRASGGFAILLASDAVKSTASKWSAHTKWHRRWMSRRLQDDLGAEVCFIQITVDEPMGEQYIAELAKHRQVTPQKCMEIIANYQDHYVPIQMDGSEQDTPFVQLRNYNQEIVVNQMMQSFVGSEVCYFLSNLHPYKHTIYLSRHGESVFNVEKRIGGDSGLSLRGEEYARRLAEFSDYVVCGGAKNMVCATLTQEELQVLGGRLVDSMSSERTGVFTAGDWSGYGDTSGGVVAPGMQVIRLQLGYGTDFVDAPSTVSELLAVLTSKPKLATVVLIEGEAVGAGETPGHLWTSSLRRTIETAQFVQSRVIPGPDRKPWFNMRGRQFRNLDEVYAGEFDGLTEREIMRRAPAVIEDRKRDKLGFRYPRGESYYDVIARLESVLVHLERHRQPTMIISHQAVLRLVLGWLTNQPREDVLSIVIPQHEVIKVEFDGLGGPRIESRFPLGPEKLKDDGQGRVW